MLALKGNQGTLHQAVVDHVLGRRDEAFAGDAVGRLQAVETSHGRREPRMYIQLESPYDLPGLKSWRALKLIGVAISEVARDGETTDDFSSLPVEPDAKAFAHAVRSDWGVENGCHWTLDVAFREDESRIREEHLRENMAWLNRFGLSLLRQDPGRESVAMKRRACGSSETLLLQVVRGAGWQCALALS